MLSCKFKLDGCLASILTLVSMYKIAFKTKGAPIQSR